MEVVVAGTFIVVVQGAHVFFSLILFRHYPLNPETETLIVGQIACLNIVPLMTLVSLFPFSIFYFLCFLFSFFQVLRF